jgi:hypothetical protein
MEPEQVPLIPEERPSRPLAKDRPRGIAHAVLLCVSVALGSVYCATSPLGNLKQLSHLDDPKRCPLEDPHTTALPLRESEPDSSSSEAWRALSYVLITTCACVALSTALIALLVRLPLAATWVVIATQALAPALASLALFAHGSVYPGLGLLAFSSIVAFFLYLWRSHISLSGELLRLSALALNARRGLAGIAVLSQVGRIAVAALLGVFALAALASGSLMPNPDRLGVDPESGECIGSKNNSSNGDDAVVVPCCTWEVKTPAAITIGLLAGSLTWTLLLVTELKRFGISAVCISWYHDGRMTAMKGLKSAFKHGYGTCALSALVMWVAETLRSVAESMRRDATEQGGMGGFCAMLLAPIVDSISQLLEAFTRFALSYAAGNATRVAGFMHASQECRQLLSQRLMNTFAVYFFPPLVVHAFSFIMALVFGLSFFLFVGDAVIAALSGATALAALSILSSVLIDAIDAIYVAYAMDETGEWQEVAEVMHKLPTQPPEQRNISEL